MERFGKYEVVEKIGEGGFGVIYKGYDPLIKRHVAIKTCTSDEEEIRSRFFREAEISGNLQHRNIVIVYDFGTEDGIPYMVQEYLSGEDLDRKIKRRDDIPFATKLLYLVQVARGLDYAHDKGVVHRDVKPANIRILEDETVKIMDFGIAKLAQQTSRLTQTGRTLGTAAYLAPEQIRGHDVDRRADIFSFGLMTYELLTLERPFTGEHPSTVLFKILSVDPKPITDYWPACPKELQEILRTCMQKSPDDRYNDCGELLEDLDRLVESRRRKKEDLEARAATVPTPLPSQSGSRAKTVRLPAAQYATLVAPPGSQPFPVASIDEVDLTAGTRSHHQRSASHRTEAFRQRSPRAVLIWSFILLLLAVSGGATWWFWEPLAPTRERWRDRVVAWTAIVDPRVPLATPSEAAADPPPPPAEQSAAATGTVEEPEPPAPATTSAAEAAPEEPPPPEPARGTLIIPKAWSPEMTVSINGRRPLLLDRDRSVRLPPGPYTLSFDLVTRDYQASEDKDVQLRADREHRIPIPIPRPSLLTVRQSINTPRAWLTVNGESLGWSPVQEYKLAPGSYRLVISPTASATEEESVVTDITVPADRQTVVTFDLARGLPPTVLNRPLARR